MIVRRFKINMVPGGKTEVVNISQYDFGDVLEFELYSSEGTFVVESGTTATIRGSKPDGNGISLTADLESTQDPSTGLYTYLVTVEVIQQMTAVAGKSTYEISLQKNGQEINTANFVIDVERAPLDADTLPSESVIKELVDVIDQADEIIQAAEDVEAALNTIDPTLSNEGRAADAKATGRAISMERLYANTLFGPYANIEAADTDVGKVLTAEVVQGGVVQRYGLRRMNTVTFSDSNADGHIVVTAGGDS